MYCCAQEEAVYQVAHRHCSNVSGVRQQEAGIKWGTGARRA